MKKLAYATLLLAMVLGTLWVLRIPILKGRAFPKCRPIAQLLLPPDDLFLPIANSPIDVSTAEMTFNCVFTNKYAGTHTIGVYAENWPMHPQSNELPNFDMEISFTSRTNLFRCTLPADCLYTFQGLHGDGFALFKYNVPQDFPVDMGVTCSIRILKADAGFQREHGPLRVYAQKQSEL